ncbi:transcription factor bHLH30-like isoform X1 [Vitis riparia]|uniref:transcription factor bHLH30-like isoform X1 n=1 Tax=Vitis riparia TaxID=96939 RepID=UPI00155A9F74|nr:transcription factor bHLH30-like isoform X1 [Vitis riparia]
MEGFSTDFPGFSDGFSENSGYGAIIRGGSSSSSLLVLDSERGELVRAPARLGPNEVKAEKAMVALKNHSEAERRRRGRINAHLATLRGIIPGTKKMDKASLLGEVVSHLKELKRTAAEISKGLLVPMDIDEVRVEQQEGGLDEAPYSIKASLCCDYKPGVLSDLRRALDTVHLKTVRAEIATLGGRMKNVFVMTGCKDGNLEDTETRKLHANSVHQALRSVLDKFPASQDFSSRSTSSNKRQRISIFNSSSSSPFGDFWWHARGLEDNNVHFLSTCQNIIGYLEIRMHISYSDGRPPRSSTTVTGLSSLSL